MAGFLFGLAVVEVGLVGEGRAEVAKHVVSSLSVPEAAHARPRRSHAGGRKPGSAGFWRPRLMPHHPGEEPDQDDQGDEAHGPARGCHGSNQAH